MANLSHRQPFNLILLGWKHHAYLRSVSFGKQRLDKHKVISHADLLAIVAHLSYGENMRGQ